MSKPFNGTTPVFTLVPAAHDSSPLQAAGFMSAELYSSNLDSGIFANNLCRVQFAGHDAESLPGKEIVDLFQVRSLLSCISLLDQFRKDIQHRLSSEFDSCGELRKSGKEFWKFARISRVLFSCDPGVSGLKKPTLKAILAQKRQLVTSAAAPTVVTPAVVSAAFTVVVKVDWDDEHDRWFFYKNGSCVSMSME